MDISLILLPSQSFYLVSTAGLSLDAVQFQWACNLPYSVACQIFIFIFSKTIFFHHCTLYILKEISSETNTARIWLSIISPVLSSKRSYASISQVFSLFFSARICSASAMTCNDRQLLDTKACGIYTPGTD